MWVSRYFIIFIVYGVMGWIWESTYCTIREGKWADRGFLYGPIVPIYGFGGAGISIVADALAVFGGIELKLWQVFLIGYFGSIVLEYTTSYVMEKMFHAVWWDYSEMPFNVHGRVCLPYSIGFAVAAVLIIRFLYPWMNHMVSYEVTAGKEVVSLLLMAIIAADLALTVSALTGLQKNLEKMDETMDRQMEAFVNGIKEKGANLEEHILASREKLSQQYAESMISHMSAMQQNALKRVKAFRPSKPEHFHSLHRKHVLQTIAGLGRKKPKQ